MTDWTDGYQAEIDYSYDFFRALAPSMLEFSAQSQGHRLSLADRNFTYCELGCGQGFTANLVAAANPNAQVHAMDFMPSHIAGARELAEEGQLDNVSFYERSFENFDEAAGLPESFDIIAMHGVMSWISSENRQYILNFINKRLSPGGIVYVSYNTMPGWAEIMPLRRILNDRANQTNGTLPERITEALNYATQLEEAGATFFQNNSAASVRLQSLKGKPLNYLAHEYFNDHWTPFHFEDLAAEMGSAKLSHIGTATPFDQLVEQVLPDAQRSILNDESNPLRREALRDVIVNEEFRTDLFVKGKLPHTPRGAIKAWLDTRLALERPYTGGTILLPVAGQQVALPKEITQRLLSAVTEGPLTVNELLDQGVFGEMPWNEITQLLTALISVSYLTPCLSADGDEERAERCRNFNLAVCKRAEEADTLRFLASPMTGNGVSVDRFEQLFMLARYEGHETPADWAELAWRILEPQGQRLLHEGRILETPEENLALLKTRASAFAARKLPVLDALGMALDTPQTALVDQQDTDNAFKVA